MPSPPSRLPHRLHPPSSAASSLHAISELPHLCFLNHTHLSCASRAKQPPEHRAAALAEISLFSPDLGSEIKKPEIKPSRSRRTPPRRRRHPPIPPPLAAGEMSSSDRYMAYSPSPSTTPHSPHLSGMRSAGPIVDQEKYLAELLAERHKLSPFVPVLPHSYRLLSHEILRVTTLLGNASFLDQSGLEHGSPLTTSGLFPNGRAADMNGWASAFQSERLGLLHSPAHGWMGSQGGSSGLVIKKTIRVDIPVDQYPNFNFVGRLLGPRGNSLKRVEASTECRVLIRGRGSIKDMTREEMMRGKPGYEHLDEPLHILVEAELPVDVIDARLMQAREILEDLLKPVDESQDFFKKQQLRELAMLNGTLRDEGSHMSGSVSPFRESLAMKRAKTRG